MTYDPGPPGFVLAYVVPSESISTGHFSLQLPGSQPVKLEVPVPPTSTPTPEVTTGIVQGKLIGAENSPLQEQQSFYA